MSAQEQLNELRTLKKSFSDLADTIIPVSDIAIELQKGKEDIVDAINSKGVTTSTDKTLNEIAQDIKGISLNPITLEDGIIGETMFPKGVMYNVIDEACKHQKAEYAGLVLVEFLTDAETNELSSADAYYTSDGDFYTSDTTHTWHREDELANRYIIYYYTNPDSMLNVYDDIKDLNSFTILGTVGAIRTSIALTIDQIYNLGTLGDLSLVESTFGGSYVRFEEHTNGDLFRNKIPKVLVVDIKEVSGGNILYNSTNSSDETSSLHFPSLKEINGGTIINSIGQNFLNHIKTLEFPVLERVNNGVAISLNPYEHLSALQKISFPSLKVASGSLLHFNSNGAKKLSSVEFPLLEEFYGHGTLLGGATNYTNPILLTEMRFPSLVKIEDTKTSGARLVGSCGIEKLYLPKLESINGNQFYIASYCDKLNYIYLGYNTNDRNYPITIPNNRINALSDIELKEGYLKPLDVSKITNLTADNIVNHMLEKLGVNDGAPITLTLGSTNLNKLSAEQKQIAIDKGWTLA